MKDKDFKKFLMAIDEVRAIHKGALKPGRVFKFSPAEVKKIRTKLKDRKSIVSRLKGSMSLAEHTKALKDLKEGRAQWRAENKLSQPSKPLK